MQPDNTKKSGPKPPSVFQPAEAIQRAGGIVITISAFVAATAINLWLPKVIAGGIDAYSASPVCAERYCNQIFDSGHVLVFLFAGRCKPCDPNLLLQSVVARDLRKSWRKRSRAKVHAFIEQANPSKLLTNLNCRCGFYQSSSCRRH
jgi:ATP-binding cassette subfamily B protein